VGKRTLPLLSLLYNGHDISRKV